LRATRTGLSALLRPIAGELPNLPEGSRELRALKRASGTRRNARNSSTFVFKKGLCACSRVNYRILSPPGCREAGIDGEAESGEHLVILVHGIRDIARWQDEIKQTLRADGFAVESTSYGRMNLIEFLLPFSYFSNKAKLTVWTQIQHAKLLHPNASQVSVIAHSFGTYIIAQIVKEQFAFKFHRIIFCGSVVRYDFPIEHYAGRYTSPIFNDVGTADPWPAVAQSVTTGYGSVGTYGFHRSGVEDRFHNGAGHGYFLNREFACSGW
jgi:hypothetical protein